MGKFDRIKSAVHLPNILPTGADVMKIDDFLLERVQSIWENQVEYNLTESGIHPFTLRELLGGDEIERLLDTRLGYGQTNGLVELRTAVSRMYEGAGPDNVLITNGSAEANFITLWRLLEPGDEMVLMLPNYMQIWGIARSFGITVKPFYLKEDLNWEPDLKEIRGLVGPKTRMIVLCNPNNPTGALLSRSARETVMEIAREHDAWVYADEVYRGAELDGEETPSFWNPEDKVIICGGLSKAYALPGLRIGWLVAPSAFAERAWAAHDYTSITAGILSNKIAARVLQPEQRAAILTRCRGFLKRNLRVFSDWVDSHGSLFRFIPPKAGGMAFLRYAMDINSTDLTTRLREEKSVLVIAGDCFGMDRYLRFGIGAELDYMQAGLKRVDEILEDISG